ncbi:MAG: saccharopine dehydrogenase NADP-binding domain-containing protein [Anaerolineae bacterium]|nr:saccharopine dehydrogenase NADP-binding domain-containing protein [Anaerolineae bacterium]
MSGFKYGVVGAGRQGVATAYDMVAHGGGTSVLLADHDAAVAQAGAERINRLLDKQVATWAQVDAGDVDALVALLSGLDVFLCGTPFQFIPVATEAALRAKAGMVDYGGHTPTVLKQIARDAEAKMAGIAIVPDCGMGPGMNNTLGAYAVELLESEGLTPREVYLWDGGIPQKPVPPWNYQCTFNINGLTNEYFGQVAFLRDGKIMLVGAFEELEPITFEGVGELEAFTTTGGTSTAPYTFEGKLQVYQNKTCRWPGHFAQFKAFQQLGLFELESVAVNGQPIVPRDVFHALLEPKITAPLIKDVCVMRAQGVGVDAGGAVRSVIIDLIDYYDEQTGFTAMERLTGWHAGIMAELVARGVVAPGAWPMEQAVAATTFVEQSRERGFDIAVRWT